MAADLFAQNLTRRVPLQAFLSADHVSPATGKTLAVKISKNGGSFGDPNAGATNATEIANGWYYVDLGTADTNTLGPLLIRATAASVDDVNVKAEVATLWTVVADLLSASAVATALWQDLLAGGDFGTAGSIGLSLTNFLTQIASMIQADPEGPSGTLYRFTRQALAMTNVQEVTNGMLATDLIGQPALSSGQPDFTSDLPLCTATGMASANGFAFVKAPTWDTAHDYLFAADTTNNRVLVFDVTYGQVNKSARWVLGQLGMTLNTVNSGGLSSQSLNGPTGVAYDSVHNHLWVADTGNNRVLRYDMSSGPVTFQAAVGVLGQANMTSNSSGLTAATMNQPQDVTYDPTFDRVFVADANNNRVLCFNTAHSVVTASAPYSANAVIGQPNATTNTGGTTAAKTWGPSAVLWDDQEALLFVGEGVNDRISVWNGSAIATGMSLTSVPTAPNATTTGGSSHVNQNFVFVPGRLGWDPVRRWLFVPEGDTGNCRTSIWDFSQGITYGMAASYVLGQPDFIRSTSNTNLFTLVNQYQGGGHHACAYDPISDRLFVGTGITGGRVTIYQLRRPLVRLVSGITRGVGVGPFAFVMTDANTHAPVPGKTVTATVQLDGGTFVPTVNNPQNVGNGWYKITLTAADLAGNVVALRFTASNCDDTNVLILTTPP